MRTEEIKNTYIDDVNNNDIRFSIEPDGSPELLKRLFPFASSDNGLYLFGDPESGTDNEFNIYLTDFRGIGFRKIGQYLYEAVDNLTGSNFKEFLRFSSEPLARSFKCLKKN